jgi:hypothetical protein
MQIKRLVHQKSLLLSDSFYVYFPIFLIINFISADVNLDLSVVFVVQVSKPKLT